MSTSIPPQDCTDMASLRDQIDRLDRELISLLAARAGYIDRAVELKQGNGWPARIPERVEEVVMNARAAAEGQGLDPGLIEDLWRRLVDWSVAREARVIREV